MVVLSPMRPNESQCETIGDPSRLVAVPYGVHERQRMYGDLRVLDTEQRCKTMAKNEQPLMMSGMIAQWERLCSLMPGCVPMADALDVNRVGKRRNEHPRRHAATPPRNAEQPTEAELRCGSLIVRR